MKVFWSIGGGCLLGWLHRSAPEQRTLGIAVVATRAQPSPRSAAAAAAAVLDCWCHHSTLHVLGNTYVNLFFYLLLVRWSHFRDV